MLTDKAHSIFFKDAKMMSIVTICTIRQLTRFHRRKKGWVIATDWTRINASGGCGRSLSPVVTYVSPFTVPTVSKWPVRHLRRSLRRPQAARPRDRRKILQRHYRPKLQTRTGDDATFFIEARAEYSLHYRWSLWLIRNMLIMHYTIETFHFTIFVD